METIIQTENISKSYGDFTAVDQLSLTVKRGEVYSFIGLNGAGKTTTIRMLLGMIRPDTGRIAMHNSLVHAGQISLWNKVGYMVEAPAAYPNLSTRENLEIFRRLRKVQDKSAVDRIMDLLQISQYANRKAKNLSQGNLQRLGLAKAMIHQPEILILDEPTNALDPAGIVEIRHLLKHLSVESGVTVFISSHILDEVSRISDTIAILHQGKLKLQMSGKELFENCNKKLLIGIHQKDVAINLLNASGFHFSVNEEGLLETTDSAMIAEPSDLIRLLSGHDLYPEMIYTDRENLESYFLRIIQS